MNDLFDCKKNFIDYLNFKTWKACSGNLIFIPSNVSSGKSEIKRELITGRKNLVVGRFLAIVDD